MYLAFVIPLVAFGVPTLLKVLGLVSSYWIQLWALFVLQRSSNIADIKREAKSDADHEALTSIHNHVDDILSYVEFLAGSGRMSAAELRELTRKREELRNIS